ncbi:MAG: 2-oxoglutarate dehydrogenase E1 component [Planctomycetes bacterium]|nr:2-oxoglutarate dehydrogenase E1 component [Planctomycetota bacterium]
MSSAPNGFASVTNLALLEEQYAKWKTDANSVDRDWQLFFAGFDLGVDRPASTAAASAGDATDVSKVPGRVEQQRADSLINNYRSFGHIVADLDPIGINNTSIDNVPHFQLESVGLSDADLERVFACDNVFGLGHRETLRTIIAHLRPTYCGTIGVEQHHIQDREVRRWVRREVETHRNQPQLTKEEKRRILMKVNQSEMLESFIHTKFLGQKRFSLEGGEALIPCLDALLDLAPELGVKEVVMGMAHRGRLNVLCNTLNKSYEEVFTEFEGSYDISELQGDGDVKYHLGYSSDYTSSKGGKLHVTLNANPSHLEAVDPVVLGRARGKQRQHNDTVDRGTVIPILIHGDAAMAGQGLVMEVFQLSQLEGYTTGGTIHIVTNNQIGFTTLPADARSTRYCTDIAKMVDAPIFHVNGDDVEAVVHVTKLATRFRQEFKRDVVIDIVCYRRHGHNETDEPNFTQPTLYARIAQHPRISKIYIDKLLARGDILQAEAEAIATIFQNQLQDALNTVKVKPAKLTRSRFGGLWKGMTNAYSHEPVDTGVALEKLDLVGKALSSWPADFNIHPKIKRLAEERGRVVATRGRVDWALGEMLALGTLVAEGIPARLSGQDSGRGTFSQRHSIWYDVATRERYKPLDHVSPSQAKLCIYNSPLSEAAVLGFDYGYSLAEPNMLIIWEAQFGDFVNGAQVIIDQFLCSSESKWGRACGLVMMLPHGQEGAGPEHSSARLERFLQNCAEDNMQVAYCTTAAQHYHILRRQMHRSFRKPLILMTPKGHLRSKQASSDIQDFVSGRFREILIDPAPKKAKRAVITTGKIAHELNDRIAADKIEDVAVVRIEQLYPLNEAMLKKTIKGFDPGVEFVWCQEEPQNMGAWTFIEPALRHLLGHEIKYAGREAAASPAPGSMALFQLEQEQLIAAALGITARKLAKGAH